MALHPIRTRLLLSGLAAGALVLGAATCTYIDAAFRCDPTGGGEYSDCELGQICTSRGICAFICSPDEPEDFSSCDLDLEVCGPEGHCIPRSEAGDGGDTDGGLTDGGGSDGGLPDSCQNSSRDNDETDIDCGGPTCAPCGLNGVCLEDRDCSQSNGPTRCLCQPATDCTESYCRSLVSESLGDGVVRAVLSVDPGSNSGGRYFADLVFEDSDRRVGLYSYQDSQPWSVLHVVSEGVAGVKRYPSVVRNPDGNLQVIHTGAGATLLSAENTGQVPWPYQPVCQDDGNGSPLAATRAVAALDTGGGLHLARLLADGSLEAGDCVLGTWTASVTGLTTAPTDEVLDLAIGPGPSLHLGAASVQGEVAYQTDADPAPASNDGVRAAMPPTPDPVEGQVAVAVTVDGEAFLAYASPGGQTQEQRNLVVVSAAPAATSWSRDGIAGTVAISEPGLGLDLVLDSEGEPHLAYRDKKTTGVYYAHRHGTRWQIIEIESEAVIPPDPSVDLELDPDGYPHLTFVENGMIEYRYLGP